MCVAMVHQTVQKLETGSSYIPLQDSVGILIQADCDQEGPAVRKTLLTCSNMDGRSKSWAWIRQ